MDADSPAVHEQTVLLNQARQLILLLDQFGHLANLPSVKVSTDLPPKTSEVLKSVFEALPPNTDLQKYNSDFAQKHSQSVPHLIAAYKVRQALDKTTRTQNEKDVQKLLALPSITTDDAVSALACLDKWKSDAKVKQAFREAAGQKWPEATIFQSA